MRLQTLFLPLLTTLIPLVTSTACVAGGPADLVAAAHKCCDNVDGTWYGSLANQGICVFDSNATSSYEACITEIPNSAGILDSVCEPGDGGLTSTATATSTLPPRVTFTGQPRPRRV